MDNLIIVRKDGSTVIVTSEEIEKGARLNYWIRVTEHQMFPRWDDLPESHKNDERETIWRILKRIFE